MFDGRTALVQPPLVVGSSYHLAEPLGLLLVASALRDQGNSDVVLVDQSLDLAEETLPCGPALVDAAADQLVALQADTYAFSVQCVDLPVTLAIARRLHTRCPEARIVLGGHHASLLGDKIRARFSWVDQVVRGHGETCLGIAPDHWLVPAYDLAPSFARYARVSTQPTGLVEVARGCPYQCSYCSIPRAFGRRVSHKPVEQIMRELDLLVSRGCQNVHLVHDTLTLNRAFIAELTTALAGRQQAVRWTGMTRADLVDPQMLQDLAQSGCEGLLVGVDSGDNETLLLINKRPRRYPPLVQLAQWHVDAGLASKFYFIANLPRDTPEALERSLCAAAQVSVIDPGSCHVQTPRIVPGTPLAQQVGGSLTLDVGTPYAQWLRKTVGDGGEPWDLITRHPDLFSTYYSAPGPVAQATAHTIGWTAGRLLEALPITLAVLGERCSLLSLFDDLSTQSTGHQWAEWTVDMLINAVDDYLARTAPELHDVVQFERWIRDDDDTLVSSVDHAAIRVAVAAQRPLQPTLHGQDRIYRKRRSR